MRKTPRDGAESPQEQYDELLKRGIAVQKEYEAVGQRISQLYDEGKDDEADKLAEGSDDEQLKDSMTHYLQQRVELLRKIEKLKTIEDVFPRVKRETKEEKVKVDATELIRMFNAGKIGKDELRAAAHEMDAGAPEELTDKEMKAFAKARYELALAMGYKKPTKEEGWFGMERNGVKFSMKHFAFTSDYGITGDDRISKMGVSVKKGKGYDTVLNYDRGWDVACTDPEVQKEIDRAIAIFG